MYLGGGGLGGGGGGLGGGGLGGGGLVSKTDNLISETVKAFD